MTESGEALTSETLPAVGLTLSVIFSVGSHLLALVVFPGGLAWGEVGLLEGVTGAVVAAGLLVTGERRKWALAGAFGAVIGALAIWFVTATNIIPLWQAAVVALSSITVTTYSIHRVELLTMGLLEKPS